MPTISKNQNIQYKNNTRQRTNMNQTIISTEM